jgi:hypothetical protein
MPPRAHAQRRRGSTASVAATYTFAPRGNTLRCAETANGICIGRPRSLGFSLVEVGVLLGLAGARHMACVKKITEQHIANIRRKVQELRRFERVLTGMVAPLL